MYIEPMTINMTITIMHTYIVHYTILHKEYYQYKFHYD